MIARTEYGLLACGWSHVASHVGSLVGVMGSVARSEVALEGCIVSFTGKFDVTFLQKVDKEAAGKPKPTPDLTIKAKKARDLVRNAERLQR